MADVLIGGSKAAARSYSFEEVAIAPSRRTRNPEDVSTAWNIDAYSFETPLLAAPMDSVVSPTSAIELARCGALASLNIEGLWCRYEDPEPLLARIAAEDPAAVTPYLQRVYSEHDVQPEFITRRIGEMKAAGITVSVAVQEGSSLSRAMSQETFFPPMMVHMVASGEASGELESMLSRSATNQERELEMTLGTVMGLFEPLMVVLMDLIH